MQFKCVSKAWYSLAQDHYLLHMYATQNNPCIILQSEHSLDDQLHVIGTDHHQYENLTRKLAPPFKFSMHKFNIAGSCNGIHLCSSVSQESDTIFIYNPFTNESKQLPPTNTSFSNQKVVPVHTHILSSDSQLSNLRQTANSGDGLGLPRLQSPADSGGRPDGLIRQRFRVWERDFMREKR
ncbi:hypothetical protein Syun_017019 [Stephania yunnanensis]|uniref:F-box protein n=1 Tax=Stephania yunnanensis TaxID=152371 RepID=A0AAP0J8H8_9MAGN